MVFASMQTSENFVCSEEDGSWQDVLISLSLFSPKEGTSEARKNWINHHSSLARTEPSLCCCTLPLAEQVSVTTAWVPQRLTGMTERTVVLSSMMLTLAWWIGCSVFFCHLMARKNLFLVFHGQWTEMFWNDESGQTDCELVQGLETCERCEILFDLITNGSFFTLAMSGVTSFVCFSQMNEGRPYVEWLFCALSKCHVNLW